MNSSNQYSNLDLLSAVAANRLQQEASPAPPPRHTATTTTTSEAIVIRDVQRGGSPLRRRGQETTKVVLVDGQPARNEPVRLLESKTLHAVTAVEQPQQKLKRYPASREYDSRAASILDAHDHAREHALRSRKRASPSSKELNLHYDYIRLSEEKGKHHRSRVALIRRQPDNRRLEKTESPRKILEDSGFTSHSHEHPTPGKPTPNEPSTSNLARLHETYYKSKRTKLQAPPPHAHIPPRFNGQPPHDPAKYSSSLRNRPQLSRRAEPREQLHAPNHIPLSQRTEQPPPGLYRPPMQPGKEVALQQAPVTYPNPYDYDAGDRFDTRAAKQSGPMTNGDSGTSLRIIENVDTNELLNELHGNKKFQATFCFVGGFGKVVLHGQKDTVITGLYEDQVKRGHNPISPSNPAPPLLTYACPERRQVNTHLNDPLYHSLCTPDLVEADFCHVTLRLPTDRPNHTGIEFVNCIPLWYPFFVLDQGWTSIAPRLTRELFNLNCKQLKADDKVVIVKCKPGYQNQGASPPTDPVEKFGRVVEAGAAIPSPTAQATLKASPLTLPKPLATEPHPLHTASSSTVQPASAATSAPAPNQAYQPKSTTTTSAAAATTLPQPSQYSRVHDMTVDLYNRGPIAPPRPTQTTIQISPEYLQMILRKQISLNAQRASQTAAPAIKAELPKVPENATFYNLLIPEVDLIFIQEQLKLEEREWNVERMKAEAHRREK